jgi:hypothetical protein
MGVNAMPNLSSDHFDQRPARLYYLDWLRVIAVLGVFLFHAVHPFDLTAWYIKNAEQSVVVTFFIAFMFPWGMPFFFLLAGTGSSFALRRRTAGQFARERFYRLLLPFIGGSILLMPVMLYFEWRHKLLTGVLTSPFVDFLLDRNVGFTPIWFGALGYHLWFLGFLSSFSILCLPIFLWLKGDAGRRLINRLASMCERRGALLLFIIPLAIVRLALHPFFPQEHNWADFFVQTVPTKPLSWTRMQRAGETDQHRKRHAFRLIPPDRVEALASGAGAEGKLLHRRDGMRLGLFAHRPAEGSWGLGVGSEGLGIGSEGLRRFSTPEALHPNLHLQTLRPIPYLHDLDAERPDVGDEGGAFRGGVADDDEPRVGVQAVAIQ